MIEFWRRMIEAGQEGIGSSDGGIDYRQHEIGLGDSDIEYRKQGIVLGGRGTANQIE